MLACPDNSFGVLLFKRWRVQRVRANNLPVNIDGDRGKSMCPLKFELTDSLHLPGLSCIWDSNEILELGGLGKQALAIRLGTK